MFKSVFSKLNLSTYDKAVFFTSQILLYLPQSQTAPQPKRASYGPVSYGLKTKFVCHDTIRVHLVFFGKPFKNIR